MSGAGISRRVWLRAALLCVVAALPVAFGATYLGLGDRVLSRATAAFATVPVVVVCVAALLPARWRTGTATLGLAGAATLLALTYERLNQHETRVVAFALAGFVAAAGLWRIGRERPGPLVAQIVATALVAALHAAGVWPVLHPDAPPAPRDPDPLPAFDPMAVRLGGVVRITPRERRERLRTPGTYVIEAAGVADATSTADPVSDGGDFAPRFESNVELTLSNEGDGVADDIRISVNGRTRPLTLAGVLREFGVEGSAPADVPRRILRGLELRTIHGDRGPVSGDAVALLDAIGEGLCGYRSNAAALLAAACGLEVRKRNPVCHTVAEVRVGGRWEAIDVDRRSRYLDWDAATPVSFERLLEDPALVEVSRPARVSARFTDDDARRAASLFTAHEGRMTDAINPALARSPALRLRPGESFSFRWDRASRAAPSPAPRGTGGPVIPRNGEWRWRPSAADLLRFADDASGVSIDGDRLSADGDGARLAFHVASPYPIVGGDVEWPSLPPGTTVEVSPHGLWWVSVPLEGGRAVVDRVLAAAGNPTWRLLVRIETGGAPATFAPPSVRLDLQMARTTLPDLRLGANEVGVAWTGATQFAVVHRWREIADLPAPPVATAVRFEPDADRDAAVRWDAPSAAAFHVEVMDTADAREPARCEFDCVGEGTSWRPHAPGLFARGKAYVARVRLRSVAGVWGAWAESAPFTPDVPPRPAPTWSAEGGVAWAADPGAVAWEVHGSNVRAFLPSESPPGAERSTWCARVASPAWTEPPSRPFAFYRVRAVSTGGVRSGWSDVVVTPRPRLAAGLSFAVAAGASGEWTIPAAFDAGRLVATHVRGPGREESLTYGVEASHPAQLEWALGAGAPAFVSIRDGCLVARPGASDAGTRVVPVELRTREADGTWVTARAAVEIRVGE